MDAQSDALLAQPPPGVKVKSTDRGLLVKVRAGSIGWRVLIAMLIAVSWTIFWANILRDVVAAMKAGTADNPGPTMFVLSIVLFIGVYCTLLCLWTVIGHERLVVRNGRLMLSSPWRFGRSGRKYDMRYVKAFQCAAQDCGPDHGGGCACAITTVDYPLTFGYGEHRVSVFPHLPNTTKDWLGERLNAALQELIPDFVISPAQASAACGCGHDHAHDHRHDHEDEAVAPARNS